MYVTVKSLNRRSSPVINVADKSNIIDTVAKGYTFASTGETKTKAGTWYTDRNGYYYWGGGVSPQLTPSVSQPSPRLNGSCSPQQIQFGTGATNMHAQKFAAFINDTCIKYEINTVPRLLCFFAQVGHESGGLFYTEELASGSAYEGRVDLGNTQAGDGPRYKGRGLIQISGRANYSLISSDLGVDFVSTPNLLGGKNADQSTEEQLRNAATSAGWYWNRHNLNSISDKINIHEPIEEGNNLDLFIQITIAINGGKNGINDRIVRYRTGLQYF
jgi:putative chitinase